MIDNVKRLVVGSVCMACVMFVARGAEGPWQVVTINQVSWVGNLKGGAEFEVHIEAKKPKASRAEYFGAVEQPESVVSEITVKIEGRKISFPKPAFEDLANPLLQTMSVTSQPTGEVKLRFLGGNSAATFEVEYLIESARLTQRTLKYFEGGAGAEKHEVVKTTTF